MPHSLSGQLSVVRRYPFSSILPVTTLPILLISSWHQGASCQSRYPLRLTDVWSTVGRLFKTGLNTQGPAVTALFVKILLNTETVEICHKPFQRSSVSSEASGASMFSISSFVRFSFFLDHLFKKRVSVSSMFMAQQLKLGHLEELYRELKLRRQDKLLG